MTDRKELVSNMAPNEHIVILNNNTSHLQHIENETRVQDLEMDLNMSNNNVEQRNGTIVAALPNKHLTIDDKTDGTNLHYRKLGKVLSQNEQRLPIIRPNSFNRTNSYATSLSGYQSQHSENEHATKPPSTPHEKSKMTRRYLSTIFGICYAIFLLVFGTVTFVIDAVTSQYPVTEAFCITILLIGFIYFIFLYVDIRFHVRKAQAALKERERRQILYEEYLNKLNIDYDGPLELKFQNEFYDAEYYATHELRLAPVKPVSHKYCFMTGRHGEFFYLKLGAAWFGFGLLIHSVLQITYQIIFLTSGEYEFYECASVITLSLEILFPLYSFFVLFFIYKYINVIINVYRGLARLFLMHAIGTALAFWVYTIVRETSGAIALAEDYEEGYTSTLLPTTIEDDSAEITASKRYFEPNGGCLGPSGLNYVHRNISPYLYPFIIEYCILIVGIFYMIWANISHCPKKLSAPGHGHDLAEKTSLDHNKLEEGHSNNNGHGLNGHINNGHFNNGQVKNGGLMRAASPSSTESSDHCETTEHDGQFRTNLVINADCHASNRGLFAGLVLVVVTIVFIILFFIAVNNEDYLYTGVMVNRIFELTVLVIMIVAVILAYMQTSKLDINHHPMSKLDDVLLFIAIPAFFLETVFSMVPAVYNGTVLTIFIVLMQIVQVLIQTPFIIDGLRRCSNEPMLRKNKPGRELVTFLTIANVSLWIFYTFSVKTTYTGDERYDFYGYTLWNILNHISLPLIMFYRFHSSVCLVDIWRHSYEPEPHGH